MTTARYNNNVKYAGNITILDDQGNVMFDRDLSADDMIEELLADRDNDSREIIPTKEGSAFVDTVLRSGMLDGVKKIKHDCCGSKQQRHKKGCLFGGNTKKTKERIIFSERTFNTVKDMLVDDSIDSISRELGLDIEEIKKVEFSRTFDQYFKLK